PLPSRSATVTKVPKPLARAHAPWMGVGSNRRGGCAGHETVAPLSVLSAGLAGIEHLARDVVEPETLSLLVPLLGGLHVTLLSVGAG
ncbi:MAG: hypothetical protein WBP81_10690, partial [Solirubrobacteraceae bacterium]